MSPAWWDEVARFVDALEATQRDLLEALRLQRGALATGHAAELDRLSAVAGESARRLQQLSVWRARLLEQAAAAEGPVSSLMVALGKHVNHAAESLRARLQAVQGRFGELRREAWIQWIISHRSHSVYAELLDLIAHRGQQPPVYGDGPHLPPSQGGVMLDAAA